MPGRILVVDDVATNRTIARAKLAANYYDVIEADCGERAIDLATREEPDLILLDVLMPGIDGFETCRRLKNAPQTEHIPVVMLTALDQRSDRLAGLEAGADDFLTKPYPDMALFTRVSSLIRMKQMVDELRLRHETSRDLGLSTGGTAEARLSFADSTVLIVCDPADPLRETAEQVRGHLGCAIETAENETAARALIESNQYDACIIGTHLAKGDVMRVASLLRARPQSRHTAVMMLFRPEELSKAHLAMEMGISDYLTHPPDFAELAARLKIQLRRKHYSDRLRSSVHDSLVLAVTDPLTGLYNRRYANSHIDAMVERAEVGGQGLAAMVLDLDRFKSVNDTFGHCAGDEVLREFAHRLREAVRGVDLTSRMGGEEFLVVMPDISPENAKRVAERVRHAVESRPFVLAGTATAVAVTVSIGLAYHRDGESTAALIARADEALYRSKAGGRNMVTLANAA